MKFLLDECVLGKTAALLKSRGFNVSTIQDLGKSSAVNGAVLNLAKERKSILITTDLGFANLLLYPIDSHCGIIVLRPRLETEEAKDDVHKMLFRLFKEVDPAVLINSLVIIDRDKYRIRRVE